MSSRPGKSGKKGAARMSEADLAAFKQKNGAQRVHDPMDGRSALMALDIPAERLARRPAKVLSRPVSDPALANLLPILPEESPGTRPAGKPSISAREALAALLGEGAPRQKAAATRADGKKKRRGVELKPIMDSLTAPVREALVGEGPDGPSLSVWFAGARLLTVNELFSILPFRKYDTWKYKKRWKALIQEALGTCDPRVPLPFFDGPTRLVLFRRGTNKLDLDSFQTVFKYAIDGLRGAGVLMEDNPEVVVETVPEQRIGPPAVGLRLERLHHWVRPEEIDLHQTWFGTAEPPAPALPVRPSRVRAATVRAPNAKARGQAVTVEAATVEAKAKVVSRSRRSSRKAVPAGSAEALDGTGHVKERTTS